MTEHEKYQEHIQHTHDVFCKTVIRHAAIDAARSIRSRPYGCGGNHAPTATNGVHPLRQPVRAASSPRGGAKAAAPQREAKSLPYGLRRFWQQSFNKPLCCVGFGSPNRRPLRVLFCKSIEKGSAVADPFALCD